MTNYHLDTAPTILQDAVIDAALTEAVRILYSQPYERRMAYVQALCAALEPGSAEDQLQGLASVVTTMKNNTAPDGSGAGYKEVKSVGQKRA